MGVASGRIDEYETVGVGVCAEVADAIGIDAGDVVSACCGKVVGSDFV